MVNAAHRRHARRRDVRREPFFGLAIPTRVPGVPDDVLDPRSAWSDTAAYDAQAKKLAGLFAENFAQVRGARVADVRAVAIRP